MHFTKEIRAYIDDCVTKSVAMHTRPLLDEIELLKNAVNRLTPSKEENITSFYCLFKDTRIGEEIIKRLTEKEIIKQLDEKNSKAHFKINFESSDRVSPIVCLYKILFNKGYLKEGISITKAAASFCEAFYLEQKSVECFYPRPAKRALKKYSDEFDNWIPELIDLWKQLKTPMT